MDNNAIKLSRPALARKAARWGDDYDLIQGQGGNLSEKSDGVLYIKGSGARLGEALTRDIFVGCDLHKCLAAYRSDDELAVRASAISDGRAGLKPSIETSLHVALPLRFVFHYHCVNAIAATVSGLLEGDRKSALDRLGAVEVEYVQPGLHLAKAIEAKGVDAPAYILRNHGVVLQADDLERIEDILNDVSRIIAVKPAFNILKSQRHLVAAGHGWSEYVDMDIKSAGRAVIENPGLRHETLYPDHAVILGPGVPARREEGRGWLIDRHGGVQVEDGARGAVEPMIEAFVRVLARLDFRRPRMALSSGEVTALLNWDAEKERQAMTMRMQTK